MPRVATPLILVLVLGLGSACVSQSKYDALRRERDVYASQGETLTRETEQLADVAASLEDEISIRDEEIAILEKTQRGIEAELETLIVAGLVVPMLGRERIGAFARWWESQPDLVLRLWGVAAAGLGALLIFAVT